jgi:hypothetical protein
VILFAAALPTCAQTYHVYVGDLQVRSALIAWGTTEGRGNNIGRDSKSHGKAELRIGSQTITAEKNWAVAGGLDADREYSYEVILNGHRIGGGAIRTLPENPDQLSFYVLGDWGNGSSTQYRLAEVLAQDSEKRRRGPNPPRFILTTGDNIYSDTVFGVPTLRNSGDADNDWRRKFFMPYAPVLRSLPFYASPGNHDGNESEVRGDLAAYLDNFFFPGNRPSRYYSFPVGNLVEFFSLDSTWNTQSGPPAPFQEPGGEQSLWLEKSLKGSKARWKIPYFHHPPYNAGPRHIAYVDRVKHWMQWFQEAGVRVVFNGHEHNFQFTKPAQTGGILYVISGSAGELRSGNVETVMNKQKIAGWAPVPQFLFVEIDGGDMRITPISLGDPTVVDENGKPLTMPIRVRL